MAFRRSFCLLALAGSPLMLDGQDAHRHAICILYPLGSTVRGLVSFSQPAADQPVSIACSVRGLLPNGKHGLHIHEFGDLTGPFTTGPHFNPLGRRHGSPFGEERHSGDLGNLQADPFGSAYLCLSDKHLTLFGPASVLGRAVVVKAGEDDLGRSEHPESAVNGAAGRALASGVIGWSKEFKTVPPFPE
jgi:superoxide dismutase, Cu-Zn family